MPPTHHLQRLPNQVLAPFPSERLRLSLLEHHLRGASTAVCVTREALEGLARRLLGRSATEVTDLSSTMQCSSNLAVFVASRRAV